MTIGKYTIHGRDAKPAPEELKIENFPYKTLMGDWMIVGSSLPLWKARSDVLCKYTPHSIPSETSKEVSFSDEIWWEQLDKKTNKHLPGKGANREKRSIVRGRNKVDPKGLNGASYLWRGYNFLKPFTSHWQLVAYNEKFLGGNGGEEQIDEPIWIVTYFTATLFTEAGIDLYVRGTLSDSQYEEIVEALKNFQGDSAAAKELRELANKMFRVPVGNI